MSGNEELPKILKEISVQGLERIDVGLEGDWSPTVVTVWSRETGLLGFSKVTRSHPRCKPSLELYFENAWVGIQCFKRIDNQNVFNEELAIKVIEYVEESFGVHQENEGAA